MSDPQSDAKTAASGEEHPPCQHHHFDSMTQQSQSTLLGIWCFMAQEILFFGGLFGAYTFYRNAYHDAYVAGAGTLDVVWGLINTVVLIASSVTVVFAVQAARREKRGAIVGWLLATLVLGGVFLGVKAIEYTGKYKHHLVPGDGRLLEKIGIEPKPFDFAHYREWSARDALMGANDNGEPRHLCVDNWMRYGVGGEDPRKKGFRLGTKLGRQREFLQESLDLQVKDAKLKYEGELKNLQPELRRVANEIRKAGESELAALQSEKEKLESELATASNAYHTALAGFEKTFEDGLAAKKAELERSFDEWKAERAAALAEYKAKHPDDGSPTSPYATGDPAVPRGIELYFSLYFAMSGMHALHMVIGAFLLLWVAGLAARGVFTKDYYPHVEYFGLYWHFVDIVWIFLFPLLYLI